MFFKLCWRAPCTVIRSSIAICGWTRAIFHCGAACAGSANCAINRPGNAEVRAVRAGGCGVSTGLFFERFSYMAIYECRDCGQGEVLSAPLHLPLRSTLPLSALRNLPRLPAEGPRQDRSLAHRISEFPGEAVSAVGCTTAATAGCSSMTAGCWHPRTQLGRRGKGPEPPSPANQADSDA